MAIIVRDPLVADHIVERDLQSAQDCAEVRRLYEEGYLVLLRGQRFDLDYDFLNSLDFDVDGPEELLRKLKKYGGDKVVALTPTSENSLDQFVFQRVFGSDAGRLSYFQEQVRSGDVQSDALYARIFPNYENTRRVYTWRFTSTMFENLHWDNFGIPEPFHQVRIFTNIASSPRLWRTSHRIDDFADSIYDEWKLGEYAGRMGDDLNRFINKAVLGGMKTPCLDRQPKNHIAFAQGDVWLCETRIVAHQIYHGEKAFAAMYFSTPQSMDQPELTFDARIAGLHQRHGYTHEANQPLSVAP
jgi:hypothetical protein